MARLLVVQHLLVAVRFFNNVVLLFEDLDLLCFFLATGYEVAIECELVVRVARWLWKLVFAWVEHDVSLFHDLSMLVVNDDLKCKQKQAVLLVDVIRNRAEGLVGEPVRDLFSVDLKCLTLPVFGKPAPVALIFLL